MLDSIELAAVITSAIYGSLLAARKELDIIGSIVMAYAVAFGGGTLRDLFLDRHPLFWIQHERYALIVFWLAILGTFLPRLVHQLEPYLAIPDAIGLGLFSVVGTAIALECGTTWFIASLFGVITGTFGGVIGDVICNEIPRLFRPSPLYATCAFVGAWVYMVLNFLLKQEGWALAVGLTATVALRLASVRWGWTFPSTHLTTHKA